MSNTEAEPIITTAPAAIATEPEAATPGSYPMSREGRRQAIILLLGVISIWVFALWSLITILQGGLSGVGWISSVLMLGILLVAPLVAWTLLEEANSRINTSDEGITYSTLGNISLKLAWADIAGFKDKGRKGRLARFFLGDNDDDNKSSKAEDSARAVKAGEEEEMPPEDEPETILLALRKDPAGQIASPVVRFLHKQAHGDALPIYGGLENRKGLLAEISSHINE